MSSIANYELLGWPKRNYSRNGFFTAERKVRMAWSDVDTYISELAGTDMLYPYDTASGATVYAVRIEPQPYQAQTALAGTGLVSYPFAWVTIWYSTDAPRYFSGKFITESVQPYREFHTVSPEKLSWDAGKTEPVREAQGYLFCGHVYVVTFYHVTSIPAGFFDYNGYCNSNTVVSYTFSRNYAVQTLLHADPEATRTMKLGGTSTFQLRYRWTWRGAFSATWNKKWNPATQAWAVMYENGSPMTWHPTVNFSSLVP